MFCSNRLALRAAGNALLTAFFLLCLGALLSRTAGATNYTLIDDNSSITLSIDNFAQATVNSWVVDGVNHLEELSNWWRIGSTNPESSVHLLPIIFQQQTAANTLTVRYLNAGQFRLEFNYGIDGGPIGSGISHDMGETVRITNLTAQPMEFHFFEYLDLDLTETPFDDSAQLIGPGILQQTDMSGTIATGGAADADHYEIEYYPTSLTKLDPNTDGNATTLSDTSVGGPGEVTWAFQWDFDGIGHPLIPGNTTVVIEKSFELSMLVVPEPASITLATIAAIALLRKRAGHPR